MSNCTSPNPCQTDSGSVIYTSGNLSCIGANTNDSLSFVLFKLNQKICELQEQLDECCSSSTTTSTTSSTTTVAPCNNPIINTFNDYTTTKYVGECVNPGDELLDTIFSPGGGVIINTTTTTTTAL